jgi:hypothetical protein
VIDLESETFRQYAEAIWHCDVNSPLDERDDE